MDTNKKWYQSSLAAIGFLVLFFPIGLFLMWKYTSWNKVVKYAITGFFVLAVIGSNSPSNNTSTQTTSNTAVTSTPVHTSAPTKEVVKNYIFDVPSLIGKDIDHIRTVLGEPADGKLKDPNEQQLKLGTKQWDNTFQKDNKELLVTYDVKTRKVIDIFISSDDSSGATKDTKHLLEIGKLSENDPKYKIEFVKALKDPSSFTGVKVIPQ